MYDFLFPETIKEILPNMRIEKIDNEDINLTNKKVVFIVGTNYHRKLFNLNITFKRKYSKGFKMFHFIIVF